MRRRGPAARQCGPPLAQRLQQCAPPDTPKLPRTRRQILARSLHQRAGPRDIPCRMMMKRDRRLDQPLQKSLLHPFRFPPDVFPNLMRVIELARIEEPNPPVIAVSVHCRDSYASLRRNPTEFSPLCSCAAQMYEVTLNTSFRLLNYHERLRPDGGMGTLVRYADS